MAMIVQQVQPVMADLAEARLVAELYQVAVLAPGAMEEELGD